MQQRYVTFGRKEQVNATLETGKPIDNVNGRRRRKMTWTTTTATTITTERRRRKDNGNDEDADGFTKADGTKAGDGTSIAWTHDFF